MLSRPLYKAYAINLLSSEPQSGCIPNACKPQIIYQQVHFRRLTSRLSNPYRVYVANLSAQSPGSESGASHINPSIRKRFVLRMRTAVCTEIFSDQFGQFEDALTDRDIVTSKKLWSSWLAGSNSAAGNDSEEARTSTSPVASPPVRSPSVHESKLASFSLQGRAVLPADHIRVDLLFAEESRYVNAKKYVNTQNSQAYLNALQLVLSCHCDRY